MDGWFGLMGGWMDGSECDSARRDIMATTWTDATTDDVAENGFTLYASSSSPGQLVG